MRGQRMDERRLRGLGLAAALSLTLVPGALLAQTTLTDALITAYRTSPQLDSSRAALRAFDEEVPQIRSNLRPQISGTGSIGLADDSETGSTDTYSAGLEASLLLFDSGETAAGLEAARNRIAAARADLKNIEQLVLLNAVQAFVDIRRDLAFVELARSDVGVLEEELSAAQDRFEVGEITRTDVSLTEAQLAESRALLTDALGQLEVSRAAYLAAVGVPPDNLQPPPPAPALPDSYENAVAVGLANSPQIISAQFTERAAVYDVDRARAASRLSIQAQGSARWDEGPTQLGGRTDRTVAEIGFGASLPLYTGGRNSSLIREALNVLAQREHELQEAGRTVTEQVATAWSQREIAGALIGARQEQVEAATLAAEGVSEEARLGARSQIDVLAADQDRLEAEAEVVRAERDAYFAAYNLLSSMGLLTVEHLGLGIETYDPDLNYLAVAPGPVGGTRSEALDRIRARWER